MSEYESQLTELLDLYADFIQLETLSDSYKAEIPELFAKSKAQMVECLEAKDKLIAELVEALEPFAEQADRYDPPENDSGYVAWNSPFYIGDLRGARSASLRAKEQE